jgi:hypothetical protein
MFGPGQKPFAPGALPLKHTQLPLGSGLWKGGQVEVVGAGDELGTSTKQPLSGGGAGTVPAGQGVNTRHPLSGGGAGTVPGGQGALFAVPMPAIIQKKPELKQAPEIRRVAEQTDDRSERTWRRPVTCLSERTDCGSAIVCITPQHMTQPRVPWRLAF